MVTYPSDDPAAISLVVTSIASMAFSWNFKAPKGFKFCGFSQENSRIVLSHDPATRILPSGLIFKLETPLLGSCLFFSSVSSPDTLLTSFTVGKFLTFSTTTKQND